MKTSRPVRSPRARSGKLSDWDGSLLKEASDLKLDDLKVPKSPQEMAGIMAAMKYVPPPYLTCSRLQAQAQQGLEWRYRLC